MKSTQIDVSNKPTAAEVEEKEKSNGAYKLEIS